MYKAILTASALALSASVAPALAHDDDDHGRYGGYSAHSRFHNELREAHERAHEEGFSSWEEHRAFHRALDTCTATITRTTLPIRTIGGAATGKGQHSGRTGGAMASICAPCWLRMMPA